MESIDKLREFVREGKHTQLTVMPPINLVTLRVGELTNLIDAVDEENDELMRAAYRNGMDDADKEKSPIDEDGVPWRNGDLAQNKNFPSLSPKVVCGTGVINDKPVLFYVSHSGHSLEHHTGWDYVENVRHHHEPSVEDVLRDYASRILIAGCIDEEDELVAEYAAKLRLAGDE